jgi:hypothetical protein
LNFGEHTSQSWQGARQLEPHFHQPALAFLLKIYLAGRVMQRRGQHFKPIMVTVAYTTPAGTARAGRDYTPLTGTLTFIRR